jgi:anhydro-N-acetylmuramic acid kinase
MAINEKDVRNCSFKRQIYKIMIYRVLGIMSGSSLDGLDIAYVHLHSGAGKWGYTIVDATTIAYPSEWTTRLDGAGELGARDYLLLHNAYGRYIGTQINQFIRERNLDFQVQLVASHGHTVFHFPDQGMTAQLGDGASISALTGLQVVSDLRSLDVAFGGQGAPIVPIGEKWLFPEYRYFLNLGGIANVSIPASGQYRAFDVCPANRVLNLLARQKGSAYDKDGVWAASGRVIPVLLDTLNSLDYYRQAPPKSLGNAFGTDLVYGIIRASGCSLEDCLRTYVEHIAIQVSRALSAPAGEDAASGVGGTAPEKGEAAPNGGSLLVTGGGAHNAFLMERIGALLEPVGIRVVIPEAVIVDFKEALVMALIGVLRLRQEENTLASVTGAQRNSIGGALWNGQEG